MATTVNYGWVIPTNGADAGTWGTELNADLVAIDAQVALCAPMASPVFTGVAASPQFNVTNAAATERWLYWTTAGTARWGFHASATAETGSNAGTDFYLARFSDAGSVIDNVLTIVRSTGAMTIQDALTVNGVLTGTGGFVGNVTGNASTATALATPRQLAISGDLFWAVTFNGTADVTASSVLATVNSNVGNLQIAKATVNGKGLITAVVEGGILQVQQQQTSGTANVETIATTTWTKRTVNTTVINTITGASIASSQITLPAGTYQIDASAGYFQSGGTNGAVKIRLRNVTDSTTALVGLSQSTLNATASEACLSGVFTIAGTKVLEIDMYSTSTATGNGGAPAASSGEVEVYVNATVCKVG